MTDMTYKQLQQDTAALTREILHAAAAIQNRAQQMADEANDTGRLAETISALKVDSSTVAETRELAAITAGLSQAAIAYATAGDTTAKAAQAVADQAKDSHDGINEAVNRSGVQGIHDVNRSWFTQE